MKHAPVRAAAALDTSARPASPVADVQPKAGVATTERAARLGHSLAPAHRVPAPLRGAMESLSGGMDLSNVRIVRGSAKPAQVDALAYTQGNEIHLGPGQDSHLPHELWHVVQQRQRRVRVTTKIGGKGVNDDATLEREADAMGARALQHAAAGPRPAAVRTDDFRRPSASDVIGGDSGGGVPVQRVKDLNKVLESLGKSKGPLGFYDHRATTGYAHASGKRRQGPHTLGHITKRVAMAAAVKAGLDPMALVGSSAMPRPRVMNKMLRDRLRVRNDWKVKTRVLRTKYLKAYQRHWVAAQKKTGTPAGLSALRQGMELNPATVYNIGSGKTTAAEIAGKGENRRKAERDVRRLLAKKGRLKSAAGLETMDLGGATSREKRDALRMTGAIKTLLRGEDVASDSGESSSDSEMELED